MFYSILFYSSMGGSLCNVSVWSLWVCADCLGGYPRLLTFTKCLLFSSVLCFSRLFFTILFSSFLFYSMLVLVVACVMYRSGCYGCVPIAWVVAPIAYILSLYIYIYIYIFSSLILCSLLFSSVLHYPILLYSIIFYIIIW